MLCISGAPATGYVFSVMCAVRSTSSNGRDECLLQCSCLGLGLGPVMFRVRHGGACLLWINSDSVFSPDRNLL